MFELEELTDEIRAAQAGDSVRLSAGSVYYQLDGAQDGQLVVLIHGMSIPSLVWDRTWESLVEEGCRVLRYDLYGRGYSDRRKLVHNIALYVRQLFELLEALDLGGQPVNIIGFSLGGGIGASFAAKYPDLVRSIVLIDPAHPADMGTRPPKFWKLLIRFRMFVTTLDERLVESLGNNFYRYEDYPDIEDQFCVQMQYKGFARAIISTMIDFEFAGLAKVYEYIGRLDMPSCLIWGEEDSLAEFETSAELIELMPGIKFQPIAKAGHMSHYERPDLVNPILSDFLKFSSVSSGS